MTSQPYSWITAFEDERLRAVRIKVESWHLLRKSLQSGTALSRAQVPKDMQTSVVRWGLEYLKRAIKGAPITEQTIADLESLQGVTTQRLEDAEDKSLESTAEEEDLSDQVKVMVNRVLMNAATAEITRLRAKHKNNARLLSALDRAEAYPHHELVQLSKAHEDLWPENREDLRHEVFVLKPKQRIHNAQAMFGVLSEIDRYIQEVDQVLESLSLVQLSPSEKNTLLNKAIHGSRLRTMLDDERSHMELFTDERKPLTYEVAHAFLMKKTRRLQDGE